MSSLQRMLTVLDVFSDEVPVWTVEGLVDALGYTRSTVYRYVRELCEAGLLAPVGRGGYILGPRIIELDRQIRDCDPLLTRGRDIVRELMPEMGEGVMFLASLLGDDVVSVYQEATPGSIAISYSRGRPMPLFRGSASRVILAHLPERRLSRLFLRHGREIAEAGLGAGWEEFRVALSDMRKRPYLTSRAQIDPGVFAVSAPVFDGDGAVMASLTFVMPEDRADREPVEAFALRVAGGARRLSAAIAEAASRAGGRRSRRLAAAGAPGSG